MNGTQRSDRIVAITIAILLTAGCIVVLYPFVSALLWAVILCFVTWPTFLWVVHLIGGRRTLAATLMALLAAALLVAPFVAVGLSLADNVSHLTTVISRALEHGLPDLPAWVADIPLVGHRLHTGWQALTQDSARLTTALQRLVVPVSAGSSVQIALFVTPVLVLASLGFGPQPMDLVFFPGLVLTVFFAVLVLGQVSGDGQSHWIKGVQLLAVYLILAIVFYFAPGKAPQ